MMNIYVYTYDEANQWVGISSPLLRYPRTLPSPVRALLLTPTGLFGIIRKSSMYVVFNAKTVSLQIICHTHNQYKRWLLRSPRPTRFKIY